MIAVLLVLIIIIQKSCSLDDETCFKSLKNYASNQKLHCDSYMISSVGDMLESARKLNKYLKYKLDIFNSYKDESCIPPNVTTYCAQQEVFDSCKDAVVKHGPGAYLIGPPYVNMEPFMAYCEADSDGGPAWTVIQRRICDDVDFNRGYEEYERGFGGLYDSFWMGLERIHALTTNYNFELWIELTRLNGRTLHAQYDSFGIGSSAQNYNLLFLGSYTGDAGDGLRSSVGYAFSTLDRRQVDWISSICAEPDGGWWYAKDNCERHLNANFTKIAWMEKYYGFLHVQVAIREKKLTAGCN